MHRLLLAQTSVFAGTVINSVLKKRVFIITGQTTVHLTVLLAAQSSNTINPIFCKFIILHPKVLPLKSLLSYTWQKL